MHSEKGKSIRLARHISVIESQRLTLVCPAQDGNTGVEIKSSLGQRRASCKADTILLSIAAAAAF